MKSAFSITAGRWFGIVAMVVAAAPLAARAQTISHQDPSFTLRLPAGCVRQSGPAKALFTYMVGSPTSRSFMVLGAEVLDDEITEDEIPIPANAPRGTSTGFIRWHDLNLQVFGLRKETPIGTMVGRGVQVPLVGKAIEIIVMMPAADGGQIDKKLAEILEGLDGATSWEVSRHRTLVHNSVKWICIVLAGGLIGWKIWRRKPAGQNPAYAGMAWASPNIDPHLAQRMIEGERAMAQPPPRDFRG